MISFLVVGKNEAKTLRKTFKSIYYYASSNALREYEIIYVDSMSTDESLAIAREFEDIRVFLLTGSTNSAIARNVAAAESVGDVLIFLDADMEINTSFHKHLFRGDTLEHPFMSGQMKNIYHDKNWNCLGSELHFMNLEHDRYDSISGGFFVILRETWEKIGGMKTKYRRSQDLDLSLRLAKSGILLLRKKELFVKHYTIDYLDESRMWAMLFDGSMTYGTSLLYREHLANKYAYKLMLRRDYTFILFLLSILLAIFFTPWGLVAHPLSVGFRVAMQKKVGRSSNAKRILYQYIKDVLSVAGILLFFPREKKVQYERVE